MVILTTLLQKLDAVLLQAVSEKVLKLNGVTVMDWVVSPPGLHEYEVGLSVQLAVSVTWEPGGTGAAGVEVGEALIVQTGGVANAGPQTTSRTAKAEAFAKCRKSAISSSADFRALGALEWSIGAFHLYFILRPQGVLPAGPLLTPSWIGMHLNLNCFKVNRCSNHHAPKGNMTLQWIVKTAAA